MDNTEYEYSFKVKDIKEYLLYLEDNGYKLTSNCNQQRILYKNKNKTMARVTIEEVNHKKIKKLDFKEDKLSDDDLTIRKETKSLIFTNGDEIEEILAFLGYYKAKILKRKRRVYQKGKVKFEIDKYEYPFEDYVVAIEGNQEDVDKEYNNLKDVNMRNKKID